MKDDSAKSKPRRNWRVPIAILLAFLLVAVGAMSAYLLTIPIEEPEMRFLSALAPEAEGPYVGSPINDVGISTPTYTLVYRFKRNADDILGQLKTELLQRKSWQIIPIDDLRTTFIPAVDSERMISFTRRGAKATEDWPAGVECETRYTRPATRAERFRGLLHLLK